MAKATTGIAYSDGFLRLLDELESVGHGITVSREESNWLVRIDFNGGEVVQVEHDSLPSALKALDAAVRVVLDA